MRKNIKLFFVFILCLLAMPCFANADNDPTVCKNGCDYNDLETLLDSIQDGSGYYYIDIRDSYEYKIGDHNLSNMSFVFYSNNGSNINISGATASTRFNVHSLEFGNPEGVVSLKNLNITSSNYGSCPPKYRGMCGVIKMMAHSIIDNVTINNGLVGLNLVKGKTHNINNYTFNGTSYGIVLGGTGNQLYPQRSVNITNSHLANCNCSLVVYDFGLPEVVQEFNDVSTKRKIALTSYNIKVDSSEVNCAKYGADSAEIASNPTIYFTSSNKWLKMITKGTEFNSDANVVEGFNSKIVIDKETAKTIKLSSRESIQGYFDELKSVNPGEISWRVADPSILKIENGKVIPLKAGSTIVTATYDNTNYTVNFRITSVKGNIDNPKTGFNVFLVIALVIAGCALVYPVALQKAQ